MWVSAKKGGDDLWLMTLRYPDHGYEQVFRSLLLAKGEHEGARESSGGACRRNGL